MVGVTGAVYTLSSCAGNKIASTTKTEAPPLPCLILYPGFYVERVLEAAGSSYVLHADRSQGVGEAGGSFPGRASEAGGEEAADEAIAGSGCVLHGYSEGRG